MLTMLTKKMRLAPSDNPTAIPDDAKRSLDYAISVLSALRNETVRSGDGAGGLPTGYQVLSKLDQARESIDLAHAEIFGWA